MTYNTVRSCFKIWKSMWIVNKVIQTHWHCLSQTVNSVHWMPISLMLSTNNLTVQSAYLVISMTFHPMFITIVLITSFNFSHAHDSLTVILLFVTVKSAVNVNFSTRLKSPLFLFLQNGQTILRRPLTLFARGRLPLPL